MSYKYILKKFFKNNNIIKIDFKWTNKWQNYHGLSNAKAATAPQVPSSSYAAKIQGS